MNDKQREIGLAEVLATFRRRARVVALCVALVAAAALVFSLLAEKQYTATASLLVRQETLSGDLFGDQAAFEVSDPQRELDTNLRLLALDEVRVRAADRIGGDVTSADVEQQIEIESVEGSDVISITATSPDPDESAAVANGFASAFVAFREEADRSKVEEAQERLQEQIDSQTATPERVAVLESRVDELQTLADLQTGGVELVESAAVPDSASSPKPRRNVLIGAFGGLLLGLGLALGLEQFDRRIRRPEELQELLDLPVMGTIPETRMIRDGGSPLTGDWHSAESFRMLRASLQYFDVDHELKLILVTSASPNDGKTTTSLGLALAAAGPGSRVLLLEADLRRPSLASVLGLKPGPGLTGVLSRKAPLAQAVQSIKMEPSGGVHGGVASIDVLVAGPHPPNAAAMLESQAMERLLNAAEKAYDMVVIDTSPVGVISDPIPLFDQVDGVVLVTQMGEATRDALTRLKRQLDNVKAPMVGVVANRVRRSGGRAAYAYYGDQKAEE